MTRRLLILDAGSVAANNFIRSLKSADASIHMVGCATDRFTLKRSLANSNYLLARSDRKFFSSLRAIIEAEQIELLIANSDADVAAVSKLRDRIPCRAFLPAHEVIERCADKFELTNFLRRRGVSVPITYAVEDIRQLEALFQRLRNHTQLWCRIRKGSGAIGAIPVKRAEQARWWIEYWQEMRGVPRGMFTLSEYLPGRDITVQCVFQHGKLFIAKMLQRLSYNVIGGGPSGISSTAALGKMIYEPHIRDLCAKAIRALDARADGAFSVDLKENAQGKPCITEINAGRFANGPVVHDLAGEPSTVLTYVRLALGERIKVTRGRVYAEDHYVQRHLDMPPAVLRASELSQGIKKAQG